MTTLPTLRQLRYLATLADTLNFTAAADALLVTQSTLSSGIQELERLLDARLVERDRQNVRLTPLGGEVVERARVVLAMAGDLADHVARHRAPMTDLVRLGAIPTIAPFMLTSLVRAARRKHPKLKLALREDQTARLLERVRSGALDFALIALPYDTSGLRVTALFDDKLVLIAAKGDPAVRLNRVHIDRLDVDRLLLLEEGHCLRAHALVGCGLAERANPSGFEATSVSTLVQMVEEGMGVALIPEMGVRAGLLRGAMVVVRPFEEPAPSRRVALVARASTALVWEFAELVAIAHQVGAGPASSTGDVLYAKARSNARM